MKPRKCCHLNPKAVKGQKHCKKDAVYQIRVQVEHPNSRRITWQTWYLCETHGQHFLKYPREWVYIKPIKGRPREFVDCPVLDHQKPLLCIPS